MDYRSECAEAGLVSNKTLAIRAWCGIRDWEGEDLTDHVFVQDGSWVAIR